jgi:L-cysteine S-thiosulfotransferase
MKRALAQALATLVLAACAAHVPTADTRRSGLDDMSPATQALQRDDSQNPGLLWVQDGAARWSQGEAGAPGCSGCHGESAGGLRGVAARYPRFDAALGRPVTLGQRINLCRERHQHTAPLPAESAALLGLEAYVARASRGLPIAPDDDARLAPFRERGRALFERRIGQLDLACHDCHDQLAGGRLGGSVIPQGHPTGYPAYRLEWQTLGSLQRRLRACMSGVRAEPYSDGAVELVELELFLKQRAGGMQIDTPAVRP